MSRVFGQNEVRNTRCFLKRLGEVDGAQKREADYLSAVAFDDDGRIPACHLKKVVEKLVFDLLFGVCRKCVFDEIIVNVDHRFAVLRGHLFQRVVHIRSGGRAARRTASGRDITTEGNSIPARTQV